MKYVFTKLGDGPKPRAGQNVKVHYVGKLDNGEEFDNSIKRGKSLVFKLGQGSVIKGWEEGVLLMKEGSSATFTLPPWLGYGERGQGNGNIPPNATLIYDIDLLEVINPPAPFDVRNKDTIRMESGLKYIKVEVKNSAKRAEAFRTVVVHYTGYLEDGTVFDSSVERGIPFTFKLGMGTVIKGWDEGIAYLKKGEKARIILPPALGYGKNGSPPLIPANSTLIFDVELVDVLD